MLKWSGEKKVTSQLQSSVWATYVRYSGLQLGQMTGINFAEKALWDSSTPLSRKIIRELVILVGNVEERMPSIFIIFGTVESSMSIGL